MKGTHVLFVLILLGVFRTVLWPIYFEGIKKTPACLPCDFWGSKGVGRFLQYKSVVGFPRSSLEQFCRKFALVFAGMSQNCRLQKTRKTNPRDCYLLNPYSLLGVGFQHLLFSANLGRRFILIHMFQEGWNHKPVDLLLIRFFCTFSPTDIQYLKSRWHSPYMLVYKDPLQPAIWCLCHLFWSLR